MTSIVSAPADLVVATSDGIHVRFAGIDLAAALPPHAQEPPLSHGVQISLAGVRGQETMHRDNEFEAARLAWAQRHRTGASDGGEPAPTMPGFLVLDRVGVVLSDDLGTEYRQVAGQVAGDGTEWEGFWAYLPQPPEAAHTLRLRFTLDGEPTGKNCDIRIQ